MSLYSSQPLNVISLTLKAPQSARRADPFFFEYATTTLMFAPETDFFFEIPDAPLASLGGHVDGTTLLTASPAANDPLPFPAEDSLL
jgi:hypothetical protein